MRMERQLIRLVTGILSLFVFVFGCAGPVYQARYDYLPPESAEGRSCTQECMTKKTQCEQVVNKEFDQQKLNLQRGYQECLLSQASARSPILCYDPSKSIQPDYSNCLANHNACFQNCGGRVEERNVCVTKCK